MPACRPVQRSTAFNKSPATGRPAVEIFPDHPGAESYRKLAQQIEIDLARIKPNPNQPRRTIEPEALASSPARSSATACSSRSWCAARRPVRPLHADRRRAPPARPPAARARDHLRHVTTGDADELVLIENLQREDLTPLEEAEAMARLSHRYTQEQLGRLLGRRQSTISETVSLAGLPARIKENYRTSIIRSPRRCWSSSPGSASRSGSSSCAQGARRPGDHPRPELRACARAAAGRELGTRAARKPSWCSGPGSRP